MVLQIYILKGEIIQIGQHYT